MRYFCMWMGFFFLYVFDIRPWITSIASIYNKKNVLKKTLDTVVCFCTYLRVMVDTGSMGRYRKRLEVGNTLAYLISFYQKPRRAGLTAVSYPTHLVRFGYEARELTRITTSLTGQITSLMNFASHTIIHIHGSHHYPTQYYI